MKFKYYLVIDRFRHTGEISTRVVLCLGKRVVHVWVNNISAAGKRISERILRKDYDRALLTMWTVSCTSYVVEKVIKITREKAKAIVHSL